MAKSKVNKAGALPPTSSRSSNSDTSQINGSDNKTLTHPHSNGHANGLPNGDAPAAPGSKAAEIAEKVKELVRLAQEQGYLTYNDINDALPDSIVTAEE